MGKVWTYITMNIGLALLLVAAGIQLDAGNFLNFFGLTGTTGLNTSEFWDKTIILLGLVGTASVIIGLFGRTAPEFAFKAPFAVENMLVFLGTFVGLINYANILGVDTWIYFPMVAIFSLLGIGFVVSLIEWTFGSDN